MFMLYSRCKCQNVKYSRLVLRLDNVGSPSCDNIGEINLRVPGTVSYWAWPAMHGAYFVYTYPLFHHRDA